MEIRSFLAFDLPPETENVVKRISNEVKKSGLGAAWVKPDNIHLTVSFMGNVQGKDIPGIIEGIDKIACHYKSFEIYLQGIGVFPGIGNPRIMWLGLNGDIRGIADIRDKLQLFLESFGIKREARPFRPHLTLGRFRGSLEQKGLLNEVIHHYEKFTGPHERLNELMLYKSDLKPGGAVYTRLHSWSLEKITNDSN